MSLPDYPIKTKEKDSLNRAGMAKHVARLVNDFESAESFVVGIEGEWGSGKSSFINLVHEEIDPAKAEVLFFNPWNFSSQDQLIEDFFNALLEKMEKIQPKGGAVETLKKYKRKLKNVDISPGFGGFSFGSLRVDLSSLSSLRKELEDSLEKIGKKIMIVIDDIDRLDTKETLAIFKLVKVTANFPNCIFFLAYDRKRVVQRIDQATNKSGDDYLKKIIQTTFRLPAISRRQIRDMVLEQTSAVVNGLFGDIKFSDEDTGRWEKIVHAGFPELFQNIRDLKRYASSLRLNLSVIGRHEVNIVDFATLEAIRVFAPDFYDAIPKNEWIFTERFYGLSLRDDAKAKRSDAYKNIADTTLADNPAKDQILAIMEELFPRLQQYGGYGSDWDEKWSGNKQVASDSKFDAYFQLSAPSDEISEEEFEGMMEQLGAQELAEILPVFEKLDSEKKLRNFLKKTHDRFDQDFATKPKFFANVAAGLFAIVSRVDLKTEGLLDFGSVERQLYRLIWRLSEKVSGEEEKYKFLKNLLILNPHLYHRVDFLRVFAREKEGRAEHLAEMAAVIKRLVDDLLPDLQKAIDNDTLKSEPRAGHVIWGYTEWDKENEIKEYVKKLAQNKDDVFTVLEWFKAAIDSSTKGRYYRISKDGIGKFVDIAVVEKTLSEVDPSNLSEEKKYLYDLYRESGKDPWLD